MKMFPLATRLVITFFTVGIAAAPSQLFAQSFPAPGSMKDFSNTMVATPSTAMTISPGEPADAPYTDTLLTGVPTVPPPQGPYSPDLPETATTYEGPVGVTGIFNGNVTTGCSYDPLSHSAHRAIDDIVVAGSVGKYPLKMTRYYNSRSQYYAVPGAIGLSPGWTHEYSWLVWANGHKVVSPHGNVSDDYCGALVGVSEYWEAHPSPGTGTWRLADGGKVVFNGDNQPQHSSKVTDIYDPYGQRTRIAYNTSGSQIGERVKVTEPGGRCLWFIYGERNQGTTQGVPWGDGTWLLTRVEAYDSDGSPGSPTHPNGNLIDWVNYAYQAFDPINHNPPLIERKQKMLVRVDYSNSNPNDLTDPTHARYDYRTDNVREDQNSHKFYPLVRRCDDVRYNGPMRTIVYDYPNNLPHGYVTDEKNPSINRNISAIAEGQHQPGELAYEFTETRADGPTRTITYTRMQHYTENVCDDTQNNTPPQQMLDHYTDFEGNTTQLGYDSNWYISSVTDANSHTTTYARGSPPPNGIGEIKRIIPPGGSYPGGAYIEYGYSDHGHYITSVRDENGNTTVITRDANNRITWIEYPHDTNTPASHEEFSDFDIFGHPRTHRLRNLAYERFEYDGRGLLTDKYNPKLTVPGGADPHTHYDYYTSGPWRDRVQKMTLPANWLGFVATETYEYDMDKNTPPQPCAGRGLVTKITYQRPDANSPEPYKAFKYDQYGNKMAESNELGQATTYVYDSYNRVKTVTKWMYGPPNEITTFDYAPTEGGQSYLHTTNSPYWMTAPTGVETHNLYDPNWRKTSSAVANNPATTFDYDYVGNLRFVTDPNGHATETEYDARNRKWHVWDALRHETTFTYDDASNVTEVDYPDGMYEKKTYDAANRVLTSTVSGGTPGNPDDIVTTFHYNPSGTLDWVKDGKNQQTSFTYDESDRRKKMTYLGGQTQEWSYDNAGNMSSRKAVDGSILYFGYDNRNRKYGEVWSDMAQWRWYELDIAGRLRRALNGNSAWWTNEFADVHRDYDAAGRLKMDKQSIQVQPGLWATAEVDYDYDASQRGTEGNPTHMSVPGQNYDYTFGYDAMGRFETIKRNGSTLYFQYSYDYASNITKRHNQLNGVDQFYNPDELNRIGKIELKRNGSAFTPQEFEDYGYWASGQLYSVTHGDNLQDQFGYYLNGELFWVMYGVSGANGAETITPPGEDPAKEKTPEDFLSLGMEPDYTQTFQRAVTYVYDKAGNRTGTNDNGQIITEYTPNNINQYNSITINGGADPITNGNQHEVTSYKNVNYTYMKDEHLVLVQSPTSQIGGVTYQLTYDAFGRCVRRILNGVIKYYIYDGDRPILEFDSTGHLAGYNLYGKGIDEILYRYDPTILPPNPRTFYYQQDHEGSVTHLTMQPDANNNVILEKYRYDVFGNPLILSPDGQGRSASVVSNRFMFTGREFSKLFGFYEYRARAYNPLLGRFMSEDPKLFVRRAGLGKAPDDWSFGAHPGDAEFNLFRYCGNDPLNYVDPTGENPAAIALTVIALSLMSQDIANAPGPNDRTYSSNGTAALAVNSASLMAGMVISKGAGAMIQTIGDKLFPGRLAALAAKMNINGNRLHHMFDNPEHNLAGVVQQFGNKEAAGEALARATQVATQGRRDGLFTAVAKVGNYTVTIEGKVINGVPKVSNAFIPNDSAIEQGILKAEEAASKVIHGGGPFRNP